MNSEQYSQKDWIKHLYKNWERENLIGRDEEGNKTIRLDTEAAFFAGWNAAAYFSINKLKEVPSNE